MKKGLWLFLVVSTLMAAPDTKTGENRPRVHIVAQMLKREHDNTREAYHLAKIVYNYAPAEAEDSELGIRIYHTFVRSIAIPGFYSLTMGICSFGGTLRKTLHIPTTSINCSVIERTVSPDNRFIVAFCSDVFAPPCVAPNYYFAARTFDLKTDVSDQQILSASNVPTIYKIKGLTRTSSGHIMCEYTVNPPGRPYIMATSEWGTPTFVHRTWCYSSLYNLSKPPDIAFREQNRKDQYGTTSLINSKRYNKKIGITIDIPKSLDSTITELDDSDEH